MNKIKSAIALGGYRLHVLMVNNDIIELDVKPLIEKYATFKKYFSNEEIFSNVQVAIGGYGVYWNDDMSIDISDIEKYGTLLNKKETFYDMSKALIEYIVDFRKQNEISQQNLAKMSGISQPNIARIEKKTIDPQLSTLLKITNALGLKIELKPANHLVEFAVNANSVDGGIPSKKAQKIMELYACNDIDYETAQFALRRLHVNVAL